MENFGKFITIILLMIISPIIRGFVLIKLWIWFIVPIFQVQPIRVIEAIGIIYIISFLFAKRDKNLNEFWKEFWNNVAYLITSSALMLLIGYIAHLFM